MIDYVLPVSGEDVFVSTMKTLVDLTPRQCVFLTPSGRYAIHLPKHQYRTLQQERILEPQAIISSVISFTPQAVLKREIVPQRWHLESRLSANDLIRANGMQGDVFAAIPKQTYHNVLHDLYRRLAERVAVPARETRADSANPLCRVRLHF